jgi:hypothetical protein
VSYYLEDFIYRRFRSNVKKGKAFTIEFTPIGTVNNTTGLFYFENTDAVKQNGDKLNLNIQ